MKKADLVLEGGGVKGLGLLGAALCLLDEGYEFARVAGTSAGSIVAAFLAAGATREELARIMGRLEYARVPDRAMPRIPAVSEGLAFVGSCGAYRGEYIRHFVAAELERLGVRTFADLRADDPGADPEMAAFHAYKLVVMATDVTYGRLLRLPWDYGLLGLPADEQLVADAVRASISIPLFFRPVTVPDRARGGEVTLVDGGVLSNFPIAIFDRTDDAEPRWPTLGIKVIPSLPAPSNANLVPAWFLPRLPPLKFIEQVVSTAIVGNDQTYAGQPSVAVRTIEVNTSAVGVVDFGANRELRESIVAKGRAAADLFLRAWDWDDYKARYRVRGT